MMENARTSSPDTDDFPADEAATGGSGSPWAVPASLAPDSALLRQVGSLAPEPKHDCVFLGPSGVGKSSLLSALGRACQGPPRGDLELSLVPRGSLAELAREAARFLGGGTSSLPRTEEPVTHDFQVAIRGGGVPWDVEVTVQELPGRDLFGSRPGELPSLPRHPRARLWLRGARGARCLVLCVDSIRPDRFLWETLLPQLLDELAVSAGRLLPRLGRIGRRDLPPILSPKRQLPFDRILVLLTKIDLVCAHVARAVLPDGTPAGGPVPPLLARLARDPWELAWHLDPVQLAKDRLGEALLGQIRSAARPDARLAVGLTSAWGFDLPELATAPSRRPGEAAAFDRWSPFGLWEAVLFLTSENGEARHPVEVLLPEPSAPHTDRRTLSSWTLRERFLPLGGHR